MDETSYSYKHSFEIKLEKCSTCGAYYNISIDKSKHTCSNIPVQDIDVLEQMIQNTKPKEKSKRKTK